ncbi:DUF2231 domain-containing protein [Microbacterium sp. JZ37]|uniref:DUF2231 domain-containing protein n=1 Tax=Microbacterium sp. JZ37 TaxID=2654193 RepID=UPI002B49840E|nr:DUF2231 domain-containing protein [Microbacterium sp. JZ37]WRH17146.1 hypothetical protein GC092_06165 [Microbacterium sp. JZ37]
MNPFEVAGLPLHPLVVHGAVVLVPLTALALVLGAILPSARRRLGAVTPLAAVVTVVLVYVAVVSGGALKEVVGPLPQVARHEALAVLVPPWTIGMAVVAVAQWLWFRRRPADGASTREASRRDRVVGVTIAGLALVTASGATVSVVLAGEAGARAVWGG